ncbi:MAG TPA: hypothetical protein VK843_03085 [Planctomycetota bacterium]|nr:hypothetical protein [Planctomycetota bacterium]
MFCACAQSVAALGPLFAPVPANVAAMGNVSTNAGATTALNAALAANASLAAASSLGATAGVNVPFQASAMASLTALANGLGALQGGLKLPLTGSNCSGSLAQLTEAILSSKLAKALGGLPMGSLSALQALEKAAGAMAAASAMGVAMGSANAAAELSAMAKASTSAAADASASGGASGSASASAQASLNAAAFMTMNAALQANLGVGVGTPGGVDLLGSKLEMLGANAGGLDALGDALDPKLLAQALALINSIAAIKSSLGVNMLTAGAGFQVQPKLKSLAMSAGPSFSMSSSSSASKSMSQSMAKSMSKTAQKAYQNGLGNLLGGLPGLPPSTLLFAYLAGKLGALGIGLVQHSPCGPLCLIPPMPCPFGPADFAADIASEGEKLQAPKAAFEASAKASAGAGSASA